MWLNEHRRGPGWKRFLSVRRQHRFLLVLLPKRRSRGAPGAERLPPEDASPGASSGPWSVAPGGTGSPGTPGLWGSAPGSRLPASAARISCRGSRAPGAAPSDCTTRARARGRRRRRAFEVCGAPAGSPRAGATLVAPGLRESGFPAATLAAGAGTLRPQQLLLCQEQGRSIFLGPRTLDFSSFPFYFYSFHLATVM